MQFTNKLMMTRPSYDFRDVSLILQKIRDILLGRPHTLHGRFPPLISPRSIPAPDIPRGPDNKYSNKYFFKRNAYDSVKPPVVAPISLGPKPGPFLGPYPTKNSEAGGIRADSPRVCKQCISSMVLCQLHTQNPSKNNIKFKCAPTPGKSWWWDGHSYFEVDNNQKPSCPCPPASAVFAGAGIPPPYDPLFFPPELKSDFPQQPVPDVKDMRPKPEKDTTPKSENETKKKK